jgi:hypothetical protein
MALAYFSLGERAIENAHASLGHYYAWLGEESQAPSPIVPPPIPRR